MRRRDLSVTIALCLSLLAHGLGMFALTELEIRELGRGTYQPPFDLAGWIARHPKASELAADPEPPKLPLAQALPEPQLPEDEELFGERGSKGKAMNSSPGKVPMQAQEAPQEQAALTTNPGPAGDGPSNPGNDGDGRQATAKSKSANPSPPLVLLPFGPPVDPSAPFGTPLAPAPPPLPPRVFHEKPQPVIGIPTLSPDPSAIKSAVAMNDSPATRPVEIQPTTRPADLAAAMPTTAPVTDMATTRPVRIALNEPRTEKYPVGQMPTTTQPTLVKLPTTRPVSMPQLLTLAADGAHPDIGPATPAGGAPSRAGGGESGNKSESESDPFSTAPTFTFRNGKVEARDGRKVKTVRPKLTEAGIQAVISMEDPRVILGVKIDEEGKVTGVEYIQKSGSNEVDLPTYLAVWKWEFEPSKDKDGHPKPDALVIPFVWR
jgi:TonB family protein